MFRDETNTWKKVHCASASKAFCFSKTSNPFCSSISGHMQQQQRHCLYKAPKEVYYDIGWILLWLWEGSYQKNGWKNVSMDFMATTEKLTWASIWQGTYYFRIASSAASQFSTHFAFLIWRRIMAWWHNFCLSADASQAFQAGPQK